VLGRKYSFLLARIEAAVLVILSPSAGVLTNLLKGAPAVPGLLVLKSLIFGLNETALSEKYFSPSV
jgi:hypothetical protein